MFISVATLRRALFLVAFLVPSYGIAAECGKHDKVVAFLEKQYKETRRSIGVNARGIMEMYASDKNRTWTVLFTYPNGTSCVVTSGRHFESLKPTAILDPQL